MPLNWESRSPAVSRTVTWAACDECKEWMTVHRIRGTGGFVTVGPYYHDECLKVKAVREETECLQRALDFLVNDDEDWYDDWR